MPNKSRFFGDLPARYKFFLNPYSDMRFTRCPQCEGKTSQKKVPLMIHVDPYYPVNMNYTCRYCPKCDILIAHKDEIEGHLHRLFSERAPEVIGNDYLVMGTTERSYWTEGITNPQLPPETLANLHGFKEYLNFKRMGGWLPNEKEEVIPVPQPEPEDSSFVDTVNVDRYKPLEIHSVLYTGNEAGIACDITPRGRENTPVICSLTQLEVMGADSLAEEMKVYQKERIKNLSLYPGNDRPIGFTVTPRRRE